MPGVMRNNKYSRLATSDCSPSHKTNPNYTNSTHELLQQQIHQQEHLVQHQDAQLSQMSQSVGTLRNVSTAIGSELDEQAVMLDEFGAEIEQAETKLDATMRKMVRIEFIFFRFRWDCFRWHPMPKRKTQKNFSKNRLNRGPKFDDLEIRVRFPDVTNFFYKIPKRHLVI